MWMAGACLLLAAGCGDGSTGPEDRLGGGTPHFEGGGLSLTAVVPVDTLRAGETTTAEFRLRNKTGSEITIHFNSGGQVLPFIVQDPGRTVVYPQGGWWGCTAALTTLTLAGGETRTVPVQIERGTGPMHHGRVSLPPGRYELFAEVTGRDLTLRSKADTLVVQ